LSIVSASTPLSCTSVLADSGGLPASPGLAES
jgi:hypothetical protein